MGCGHHDDAKFDGFRYSCTGNLESSCCGESATTAAATAGQAQCETEYDMELANVQATGEHRHQARRGGMLKRFIVFRNCRWTIRALPFQLLRFPASGCLHFCSALLYLGGLLVAAILHLRECDTTIILWFCFRSASCGGGGYDCCCCDVL